MLCSAPKTSKSSCSLTLFFKASITFLEKEIALFDFSPAEPGSFLEEPLFLSEGLAGVKKDDLYGFIDKNGKEVVPLKYDEAGLFSEGLASVGIISRVDDSDSSNDDLELEQIIKSLEAELHSEGEEESNLLPQNALDLVACVYILKYYYLSLNQDKKCSDNFDDEFSKLFVIENFSNDKNLIIKEIKEHFKNIKTLLFIPYARPGGITHDEYTKIAAKAFQNLNITVKGIHEFENPKAAIEQAEGIFTGGGNTFLLVFQLYKNKVMDALAETIKKGTPYLGSSAGSNICGLTMGTTNDMPIIYPPSFRTLGFVSFNINPHYLDPEPDSTHMGEIRETRIQEFHH